MSRVPLVMARVVVPSMWCLAATAGAQFTAPRATILETARIDGARENIAAIDPDFVRVGPDGRVAIWSQADAQVWFYDASGKRIATFGREGRGPGEFVKSRESGGWVGDTLWVYDAAMRRFTLIAPGAKLLRLVPLPDQIVERVPSANRTVSTLYPAALLADGSIVGNLTLRAPRTNGQGASSLQYLTVVASSGEIRRLIAENPIDTGGYAHSVAVKTKTGTMTQMAAVPFRATPERADAAVGPSGSRVAVLRATTGPSSSIALAVFRANGDTVFARRVPYTGEAITKAAIDSALGVIPAAVREDARAKMPATYPPVDALVLGLDDGTWLQLHGTAAGRPCVLLDDRGTPVMTVIIPRNATLVQARRDAIWTVEADADDVPSVVRYRVIRP